MTGNAHAIIPVVLDVSVVRKGVGRDEAPKDTPPVAAERSKNGIRFYLRKRMSPPSSMKEGGVSCA